MLFLLALGLAALAAQPEIVLLAMAYGYLSSAFLGMAWQRWRRPSEPLASADLPALADAAPPESEPGQQAGHHGG